MVKTVILGTAHLKSTPGKCSPDKSLREYEYSRMICKRIKETLDKMGIDCIIDYEADDMPNTTPSQELVKRVKIVNDICKKKGSSNCMYVSIHLNAAGSGE